MSQQIKNIFDEFRKYIAEESVNMMQSIAMQGEIDLKVKYKSHPHPLRGPDSEPITKHNPAVIAFAGVEMEFEATPDGARAEIFIDKEKHPELEREARMYELYGNRPFGSLLMNYKKAEYIKQALKNRKQTDYPDIEVRMG